MPVNLGCKPRAIVIAGAAPCRLGRNTAQGSSRRQFLPRLRGRIFECLRPQHLPKCYYTCNSTNHMSHSGAAMDQPLPRRVPNYRLMVLGAVAATGILVAMWRLLPRG